MSVTTMVATVYLWSIVRVLFFRLFLLIGRRVVMV